jgi:hypothetical protein
VRIDNKSNTSGLFQQWRPQKDDLSRQQFRLAAVAFGVPQHGSTFRNARSDFGQSFILFGQHDFDFRQFLGILLFIHGILLSESGNGAAPAGYGVGLDSIKSKPLIVADIPGSPRRPFAG